MNTVGMLEFENKVADYIKETNNHVLYRVTPIFEENNLLASGVQMEAQSVEDNGKGIKFNVYVYNVQEGITIDYKTGESKLSNWCQLSKKIEKNQKKYCIIDKIMVNYNYLIEVANIDWEYRQRS